MRIRNLVISAVVAGVASVMLTPGMASANSGPKSGGNATASNTSASETNVNVTPEGQENIQVTAGAASNGVAIAIAKPKPAEARPAQNCSNQEFAIKHYTMCHRRPAQNCSNQEFAIKHYAMCHRRPVQNCSNQEFAIKHYAMCHRRPKPSVAVTPGAPPANTGTTGKPGTQITAGSTTNGAAVAIADNGDATANNQSVATTNVAVTPTEIQGPLAANTGTTGKPGTQITAGSTGNGAAVAIAQNGDATATNVVTAATTVTATVKGPKGPRIKPRPGTIMQYVCKWGVVNGYARAQAFAVAIAKDGKAAATAGTTAITNVIVKVQACTSFVTISKPALVIYPCKDKSYAKTHQAKCNPQRPVLTCKDKSYSQQHVAECAPLLTAETLPTTGSDTSWMGTTGGACIGLGLFLLLASFFRRPKFTLRTPEGV